MSRVAALYVDPAGPYPRMDGVDAFDKSHDAQKYDGPWPVVAHPDCGPWSRLRHLCTRQDASCGPRAVKQVRAFGGVLEHPEYSKLWVECGLPIPGCAAADGYGGRTYRVEQVWWGHQCVKPTWLYVVGVDHLRVMRDIRAARKRGGEPTHCVSRDVERAKRRGYKTKRASSKISRLTPPTFAEWLVRLARVSHRSREQKG